MSSLFFEDFSNSSCVFDQALLKAVSKMLSGYPLFNKAVIMFIWKSLLTKVYHKKTDQKQYLHYKSTHPRNQKDAVPYGLLIRARRICSKDKDFKEEATIIITALLKRGYPDNILLTAFNRARSKTQEELLKSSKKSEDMRIRLITTYNQRNPPMKQLLLKFTDWLDKTKKDISREDLQTVYKKSKKFEATASKREDHTKSTNFRFLHKMQQTMQNLP